MVDRLAGVLVASLGVWAGLAGVVQGASAEEEKLRFFETKVRPVLAEHCYQCHGAKKQESGLRLDTAEGILAGGDSGRAVVPGEVEESLLLVALSYREDDLQMPPDGKLPDEVVADLTRWIAEGAALPDVASTAPSGRVAIDLEEARRFWAFQPPVEPPLPAVRDSHWPQTPIDHFVLAALEANGLSPAPRADRRTLIRRATFDLLGLPPTPGEVEAFVSDESPEAFARVVDRLLSSPRYGERWGRHWLDVARYADSNGLDENIAHGNAWRYRDYVVSALNSDRPFDQFVVEQIAGDLLPTDDERQRHERLIATGFLTLGPKVLAEKDEQKMEMDIIDEQLDTLGRAFLGMTLGCARCHDHKFDPITTQDYYAVAGIFKSTRTMESHKLIARWNENNIATREELQAKAEMDQRISEQKAAIDQLLARGKEAVQAQAAARGEVDTGSDIEGRFPTEIKEQLQRRREELKELEQKLPELPTAMGVTEGSVQDLRVHLRGSHLSLGKEVPRGIPSVLAFDGQPSIAEGHSGRLELAHWIVRPEHPLTSRVAVNRVWRWHFGQGLVASTDNFGQLGDRPVNQPLLDWLALRFVGSGWSIKELHRLILLSSTYQMASTQEASALARDPENRLQWRANVQRLEAEAIRDSLLFVSGLLDESMGGSLLHVRNREFLFDHTSKDDTRYDSPRRSIYLPVIRNHLADVFSLFDYTEESVSTGDRSTSTIAPQALFLMNSELVTQAAESLARRLAADEPADEARRVQRLYELALGRPASEREVERGLSFVAQIAQQCSQSLGQPADAQVSGWEALCHVVLASSEFVYVN